MCDKRDLTLDFIPHTSSGLNGAIVKIRFDATTMRETQAPQLPSHPCPVRTPSSHPQCTLPSISLILSSRNALGVVGVHVANLSTARAGGSSTTTGPSTTRPPPKVALPGSRARRVLPNPRTSPGLAQPPGGCQPDRIGPGNLPWCGEAIEATTPRPGLATCTTSRGACASRQLPVWPWSQHWEPTDHFTTADSQRQYGEKVKQSFARRNSAVT